MSKSDEFKPIPYSFFPLDIENKQIIMDKNIMAYCPSFHVLLDHTIAVLWELFSLKQEGPLSLGGSQISWALRFLEGVANETDCCSVDIRKAVQCLQSAFVNCISQERPFNADIEEEYKSGNEIERIQENDKSTNQEYSDSDQSSNKLKSIVLNDMLNT